MSTTSWVNKEYERPFQDDYDLDDHRTPSPSLDRFRFLTLCHVKKKHLRCNIIILSLLSILIFTIFMIHKMDENVIDNLYLQEAFQHYDQSHPQHPHYIVFELPVQSPEPKSLRFLPSLPQHCLDSHFSLGQPCFHTQPVTFDVIWTWVNGSDPKLHKAMSEALPAQSHQSEEKPGSASDPDSKLYRDHDELRHSFRSVLRHFRDHINRFYLFTSDFPFDDDPSIINDSADNDVSFEDADNQTLRFGQLPSWLRAEEQGWWKDGDVVLDVIYHAQVFRDYNGTSFNSLSIESQFPYLPHIEQNFIYLNDDVFFTADLVPADFYTSAYGTVLRFDPGILVNPVANDMEADPSGEWGPLGYSNWLLSERFGSRPRPYPLHVAKSFSMPFMDELSLIWKDELHVTSTHKFRGMRNGDAGNWDVSMTFLVTHLVVERWREALLWSWVVGRIGGKDDQWGTKEKMTAWNELGSGRDVQWTPRKTVKKDRIKHVLEASGQEVSRWTGYGYSSMDGYPYGFKKSGNPWPSFDEEKSNETVCSIDYDTCIGKATSASEAFTIIAFQEPLRCGDCIIAALVEASGKLGLSAFLPSRERRAPLSSSHKRNSDPLPPHLPLVKYWRNGGFSLKAVLNPYGSVNIREWALRLLERYKFVIGDTDFVFLMVEDFQSAQDGLSRVRGDVSMLCMNDDVQKEHKLTDQLLRDWQERRWQTPANWEH